MTRVTGHKEKFMSEGGFLRGRQKMRGQILMFLCIIRNWYIFFPYFLPGVIIAKDMVNIDHFEDISGLDNSKMSSTMVKAISHLLYL